ncbi:family 43 glycosylhydrolase [Cellulophaga sp. 20_2_10]|uniref:family 43 glycosylhydrolase n=1 Tax=Flavobacteriaceae TaxID=49546 RepID=UPI00140D3FFB|nr:MULTISPECIES: family 43 glycosylhydrolase [Flavobacteriaceae]MCL5247618.1 family 43 glycosylhydrolase [Cellulophaga sp. 20_2_10]MCL7764958.1 family 43 glycosylhydrolase [Polaribacter sp. Z014]
MKNISTLLICVIILLSCKQEKQLFVGVNPNALKVDIIVPEHGMADPHAWVKNDTVFIIAGHDKSWDAKSAFPMDRWEIWSSADLINWNFHKSILPTQTYIGDQPNCWAGDICERDGKYYWFFSNRNIDTGVMVSDKIDGEYKDLLGKPLLPKGIVPVNPYDPEIYIENDVYTICFGVNTYYMATLSKNMKSLESKPTSISVIDATGKEISTDDKPTLFKRGDWYYLVYGNKYAMSKKLYGPYNFKGAFLAGGHTSFFQWKDQQWYVLQENHDISAFYRGASLKPVFFNEDGTVIIPKDDRMYPGPGRNWKFENSTMGWKSLQGTTVNLKEKGILTGNLSGKKAIIESAPWLYTDTRVCNKISYTIKNNSAATEMKVAIYSRNEDASFWTSGTKSIDWEKQEWITIPIKSNSTEYVTYIINLLDFKEVNARLMQMAVQPACNADSGTWEIKNISVF